MSSIASILYHNAMSTSSNQPIPSVQTTHPNHKNSKCSAQQTTLFPTMQQTPSQQQLIAIDSIEDDFLKDCKTAVADFKGVIQDEIQRRDKKGKFKRDSKSWYQAVQDSNMNAETKRFLQQAMTEAQTDQHSGIFTDRGMVAYNSSAYETGVILRTLQDHKTRTGDVFRHNCKHPLRQRPYKKQSRLPYARPSSHTTPTQSKSTSFVNATQNGITVHTLPTFVAPTSIQVDDAISFLKVDNAAKLLNEIHQCKAKWEHALLSAVYTQEQKKLLQTETNAKIQQYWTALKTIVNGMC